MELLRSIFVCSHGDRLGQSSAINWVKTFNFKVKRSEKSWCYINPHIVLIIFPYEYTLLNFFFWTTCWISIRPFVDYSKMSHIQRDCQCCSVGYLKGLKGQLFNMEKIWIYWNHMQSYVILNKCWWLTFVIFQPILELWSSFFQYHFMIVT